MLGLMLGRAVDLVRHGRLERNECRSGSASRVAGPLVWAPLITRRSSTTREVAP